VSAKLTISLEGVDDEGRIQLGDDACLVIEGALPPRTKPENCDLLVTVTSGAARDGEISEAGFSMSVDEFMSGPGPFLCQIDFEAEAVGSMAFQVDLMNGKKLLAQAAVSLRVINKLRDSSGRVRKNGAGALKVKK